MSRDERHRRFFDNGCEAIGVTLQEVLEKRRDEPRVLRARKALAWALRERFEEASYPAIGRLMLRDHTTVMHGVREFRKALQREASWALELRQVLTGMGHGVAGLESPIDSLRSCPGIDLSTATDMPAEAVG